MSASTLPEGARGDIQPAMQRRLAQLHSAMGSEANAPVPICAGIDAQTRPSDGGTTTGSHDAPKKPWTARPMLLMGGLLLLGLVTAALSQRQSVASETAEQPPVAAPQTTRGTPAALVPAALVPATTPSQDDAIRDTLERWRLDWSRRDVPAYLAHYSDRFEPAEGIARAEWEAKRRQAILQRPAIRVEVADLSIDYPNEQEARVRFRQTYLSGRYQENAQPKTLRLLREDGGWRIAGEWQGAGPVETLRKP